jgi:hypothetical protein
MSPIRACALSLFLVPGLTLAAAEKMVPTKSNPPPVGVSGSYLVDKTIPAYGVLNQVPHYTDSRANALYIEIHQVLADVESQVMAGTVAPTGDAKKKKKDDQPAAVGDARIGELLGRLVELDARIAYRTYLEQWHIDSSFSDLSRATELLALNGQVGGATVEKVKGTKPKAPEAAPAPKAPEAPAAPKADAPAPAAPKIEAPAPAPEAPVAPKVEVPEAPAAPAAPAAEAPAVPAADAPAAPAADAPAALPAAEPPAADPPADKPADK